MPHGLPILTGFLVGVLVRVILLRSDYRQYPTYPHSYVSHLFMGVIAALLGSVAIPALLEREWTAVTFLVLVAQQFRGIRSMERDSLKALEDTQLVARGQDYIENIAKVFEARYYLVIFASLLTSVGVELGSIWLGLLLGALSAYVGSCFMKVKTLGELVFVEEAPIRLDGPNLYVGDIFLMNVGLSESRKEIEKMALGAIITPRNEEGRDTIASPGQRQAILHDLAGILGVEKDMDMPEFTPMARRETPKGERVGIFIMPSDKDPRALIEVIERVPVLESARGVSYRRREKAKR